LWQKRKFWLAVQAKVPKIERKIAKETYEIFFSRKFGYYSYVFPSGKSFVIGAVAKPQDARKKFKQFLDFLKIKKCKVESALIPLPKKINARKGNVFLAGDAACQVKFTGGGIVPAIESAFALRDFIVYGNNKGINALRKEIKMHQMIAKVLDRLSDSDFNILFEIAKDSSAIMAAKSRDELRKWAVKFVLQHPSLLRFLPKLF
jgi:flavin-dependent dehydrogenase